MRDLGPSARKDVPAPPTAERARTREVSRAPERRRSPHPRGAAGARLSQRRRGPCGQIPHRAPGADASTGAPRPAPERAPRLSARRRPQGRPETGTWLSYPQAGGPAGASACESAHAGDHEQPHSSSHRRRHHRSSGFLRLSSLRGAPRPGSGPAQHWSCTVRPLPRRDPPGSAQPRKTAPTASGAAPPRPPPDGGRCRTGHRCRPRAVVGSRARGGDRGAPVRADRVTANGVGLAGR
ncbi:hypothetical protein SAMN05216355_101129 [Actinomyces ruminicola]|uniref:Uncharacterized protein n=1 Tax=Actinomyces ruminicola TaxID=332524 RepID=A0A1G9ZET7_9ACTO|nr:hypothetical protein SAMN05216355_101129 [Actinomyces ruminicola]